MKKHLYLLLILAISLVQAAEAQQQPTAAGRVYGKAFTPKSVIQARDLPRLLDKQDSLAVQVSGQVREVCQAKGCWMDIVLDDNTVMKVRFQNYSFFVPKDLKGKTVVLQGLARNQTVSVAEQRHYAQDAGKPKAAIQAIGKPKQSITYTASGVVVK